MDKQIPAKLKSSLYDVIELVGLSNSLFEKNRLNFFNNLEKMLIGIEKNSIILIQSGDEIPRNDTDVDNYYFQQESNFYYLTGVKESKFYAVLDFTNKTTILYHFVDKNERNNVFMKLPTLEELGKKYNLPIFDQESLANDIKNRDPKKIYLLPIYNKKIFYKIK